jgi:hypothetical protein
LTGIEASRIVARMRTNAPALMAWIVAASVGCKSQPGDSSDTGDATSGSEDASAATITSGDDTSTGAPTTVTPTTGEPATSETGEPATTSDTSGTGEPATTTTGETGDTSTGTTGDEPLAPMVDLTDPKFHEFEFKPDEADPDAKLALGLEHAQLDTTVTPVGKLVVYLHGAGQPGTCGSKSHGAMLASLGFHVVHPCYVSDYGVGNCGDDIGGCRLEAFEGVDHHDLIDIAPPDSIETRVVKALEFLQAQHPGGDWQFFIDAGKPRWSHIIISGISHGASSSGVIGMVRNVDRAVMLSGPLDSGQAWLEWTPMTPIDRFYGFTHTGDEQHPGHLESFADMQLPGEPFVVDGAGPPYDDSHRLVSSAPTGDGHGSTQAGGSSPKDGDAYVFLPVWKTMYGVQ